MSFLMRVEVPDQPGSLGLLATALGAAKVDILSVDVLERAEGIAVDDLVVEMPHTSFPDVLITAAEAIEGVHVRSVRPFTGVLDTHGELELVDLVAAATTDRLQVLVDGLPRVLGVGWSMVFANGSDGPYRVVHSAAAPETREVLQRWRTLDRPVVLEATASWVPRSWRDMNTALAAAPLGGDQRIVMIGRPGGPELRPSEAARLGHVAGIVANVLT